MIQVQETVEILDPAVSQLIDRNAPVEQICTGFTFSEGPIWNPGEQCLYFSDMPSDIRRRWSPRAGVVEVRNPSNKCNGMTYDGAGNLYVCEHVTSSLVMETPAGERQVLATHWQGKELNSPNDVVVRSDGTIYFTDPTYGRMPVFGLERKQDLDFQGVYRVAPDGTLHCEANDFDQPNGLCFSPDERILYVNDTDACAHPRIRRGRRRIAGRQPGVRRTHRHRRLQRRRRRRHEVRRAGQRLRHRPARHLGDRRHRPAHRRHPHAGNRRQSELGRRRLERPVLHLLHLDLSRADEGTRQSGRYMQCVTARAPGWCIYAIHRLSIPTAGSFSYERCDFPTQYPPAGDRAGISGACTCRRYRTSRRPSRKIYPGPDGKLVYVADEQGNTIHDARTRAMAAAACRSPPSPVKETIWPVAGDNTRAHPGGDRQGVRAAARQGRLPRRGAAASRLLPDGDAAHDQGQRRRAARRRHGRHRHDPRRHRHAAAQPVPAGRAARRRAPARGRPATGRRGRARVAPAGGADSAAAGHADSDRRRVRRRAEGGDQADRRRRLRAGRRAQLQGGVGARLQARRRGDRPPHRQPGVD